MDRRSIEAGLRRRAEPPAPGGATGPHAPPQARGLRRSSGAVGPTAAPPGARLILKALRDLGVRSLLLDVGVPTAGSTEASKKAVVVKKTTLAPASKKAVIKKAVGPKLTAPQHELLKKVVADKDAKGYHTVKKPEHRVLETLLKHKVVKKGPKHPETKYFHYQVSTIGKKYLESAATPKG